MRLEKISSSFAKRVCSGVLSSSSHGPNWNADVGVRISADASVKCVQVPVNTSIIRMDQVFKAWLHDSNVTKDCDSFASPNSLEGVQVIYFVIMFQFDMVVVRDVFSNSRKNFFNSDVTKCQIIWLEWGFVRVTVILILMKVVRWLEGGNGNFTNWARKRIHLSSHH